MKDVVFFITETNKYKCTKGTQLQHLTLLTKATKVWKGGTICISNRNRWTSV